MWTIDIPKVSPPPDGDTVGINLTTYGLKSIQTTGSMSAASNQLTLPAAAGFSVNDYVIVAVGGESGAGQRGTVGVGGTWPALSYPTVAALQAATQPVNTFAWAVSTGDVYQSNGSPNGWVQNSSNPTPSYYTNKAIPKALVTQITAIGGGGTVLTLAASSVGATTNAGVYFDNQYVFDTLLNFNSPLPTNAQTLYVPPGSYAIGDQIQWEPNNAGAKTNWILHGYSKTATTIFSPDGAPSAMFLIEQLTNVTVRNLTLLGNAHQNKFGLQWGPRNTLITETSVDQGLAFPSGFKFGSCVGVTAQDLNVTDVFQNAVAGSFSDNLNVVRVYVTMTQPLRQYIQWMFECADTTVGGTFTDCTVNSVYLVPGFEGFRSQHVQYIRPVGVNAAMSMNDAGPFTIQDANLTFTTNSQFDEASFSGDNPIVNINQNIGTDYVGYGGTISNLIVNQQGYINAANDTLIGVNINANNGNVTVNGTTYTAPDYWSGSTPPASPRGGPLAVNSTGGATHVSNLSVRNGGGGLAQPKSGGANISVTGTTWPHLIFATTTARDADTTETAGTFCSVTANNTVYRWTGSVWVLDSNAPGTPQPSTITNCTAQTIVGP